MSIASLMQPLIKWWWLVLTITLLAGGTSFFATQRQPALYEAHATLMIGQFVDEPNPTNTELVLSQQLAVAYADIANREPLRRATMEALNLERLPAYTIQALPGTQFLEVMVVDADPILSQAVANELADQLIRLSPGGEQQHEQDRQAFIDRQLDSLQLQIESTEAEIEVKQAELGELFSAQQLTAAQSELQALQSKLGILQANFGALLNSTNQDAVNVLTVIESAALPLTPRNSNVLVLTLAASVVGFSLAVGAAFLLEYLDDTVKDPAYISDTYDIETLAFVPTIESQDGERSLITIEQPRSSATEAFRRLRTTLTYQSEEGADRTVLVTSAMKGEGKSLVSANLAAMLAMGGYSVLLVDADLHNPSQDRIFSLNQEQGLMAFLPPAEAISVNGHEASMAPIELFLPIELFTQPTSVRALSVLTSGPMPDMPSEILGSRQMNQFLTKAASEYDYVIIDTPPVLAVTDALVLGKQVGTVLLVIDSKRTRPHELKQAISHLNSVNAPLKGVILNRYDSKTAGYGYSYTYYRNTSEQDSLQTKRTRQAQSELLTRKQQS